MNVIEEALQVVHHAEEEFAKQKKIEAERKAKERAARQEEEEARNRILNSSKKYSFEYRKSDVRNLVNYMNFSFRNEVYSQNSTSLPAHYHNAQSIIWGIERKTLKQGRDMELSIRGNQIVTLLQYLSEVAAKPNYLGSNHVERAMDFVDELGTKYIERRQLDAQNPGRIRKIFRRK